MEVDKHQFIITYHVITQENHVTLSAPVFNQNTFVRNFVSAQVIVVSDSLVVVARPSAIQNSVHVS